jgi:hypothetical protein
MATVFTIVFALACLATFLCAVRKEWTGARMTSAVIAIVSFFMALVTAAR